MANFVYNRAAHLIARQQLNLETAVLKVALVDSGYTPDRDDDFMSDGPAANEITATNYAGGHGGSGRKDLDNGAWTLNDPNDRTEFDSDDPTVWTALGGATNDTIQALVVHIEGTSDDTDATLVAYIDTSTGSPSLPFTTNGGNFAVSISADGLLQLKTA